jgi:hypothetical protein
MPQVRCKQEEGSFGFSGPACMFGEEADRPPAGKNKHAQFLTPPSTLDVEFNYVQARDPYHKVGIFFVFSGKPHSYTGLVSNTEYPWRM